MPLYIQNIEVAGFDWDSGNSGKCQKHGMSLVEIEQIFANIVQLAADEAPHTVNRGSLRWGEPWLIATPLGCSPFARRTRAHSSVH